MVVRTLEPWISKNELCEYLKINRRILEQLYPLFTEGVHYRRKNPLKENSTKVWKATKVDQLLCESSSILTRRINKIKLKNQIEWSKRPERFWKFKERKNPSLPPNSPRLFLQVSHINGFRGSKSTCDGFLTK